MKSRNIIIGKIVFTILVSIILILSVGSAAFASVEETPINDGVIQDNEYESSSSYKNDLFKLYWTVNDSTIYFGMVGQTTGWITVGFDPSFAMKDADMVFAWVESNGTVVLFDAYSTGNYGPHPPDTDQGGTFDVLSFSGIEASSITTIEFSRKLDTGDEKDNNIPSSGTIDIIWAIGNSDDFTSPHIQRGEATLTMVDQTETSVSTTTTESSNTEISPGFEMMIFSLAFGMLVIKKRKNRKE